MNYYLTQIDSTSMIKGLSESKSNMVGKSRETMGFAYGWVWVMGFCGPSMPVGYGMQFSANQVDRRLELLGSTIHL